MNGEKDSPKIKNHLVGTKCQNFSVARDHEKPGHFKQRFAVPVIVKV
jgi:hypothetical protein